MPQHGSHLIVSTIRMSGHNKFPVGNDYCPENYTIQVADFLLSHVSQSSSNNRTYPTSGWLSASRLCEQSFESQPRNFISWKVFNFQSSTLSDIGTVYLNRTWLNFPRCSRAGVGNLLVVLCRSNVAKSLSVPTQQPLKHVNLILSKLSF